jgi:hypothetical protein
MRRLASGGAVPGLTGRGCTLTAPAPGRCRRGVRGRRGQASPVVVVLVKSAQPVELVVDGITSVRAWVAGAGHFRTGAQEVTRAPQPCQEIPLEQMSGGVLARMRSDLGIGALAAPGGSVRVAAARELGTRAPPGRQCRDGW